MRWRRTPFALGLTPRCAQARTPALHCTAQHCTALDCTAALHCLCTALHCTVLPWTALERCTAWHGTALHGTAWYSAARHGTARHGTALHGAALHGMARQCAEGPPCSAAQGSEGQDFVPQAVSGFWRTQLGRASARAAESCLLHNSCVIRAHSPRQHIVCTPIVRFRQASQCPHANYFLT